VVFASGAGSNFQALIEQQQQSASFRIVALVCDRQCGAMQIARVQGIPVLYRTFPTGADKRVREAYDQAICTAIDALDQPVQLIVLAGYMRLVTPTLLRAYPHRVINVHPADLNVCDMQGNRRYVGARAVADALRAGEERTRSCVIKVDEGCDTGPVVAYGPWVPYSGVVPPSEQSIQEHQLKQKRLSDIPVLTAVVENYAKEWSKQCVEY